jgi:hypothetical protein
LPSAATTCRLCWGTLGCRSTGGDPPHGETVTAGGIICGGGAQNSRGVVAWRTLWTTTAADHQSQQIDFERPGLHQHGGRLTSVQTVLILVWRCRGLSVCLQGSRSLQCLHTTIRPCTSSARMRGLRMQPYYMECLAPPAHHPGAKRQLMAKIRRRLKPC